MRVFKYRSNYGRDLITLTCNQLFASKYEDLNDPFESMQFMDPINDESFIENLPYLTNKAELKAAYAEVVRLLKPRVYTHFQKMWIMRYYGHCILIRTEDLQSNMKQIFC